MDYRGAAAPKKVFANDDSNSYLFSVWGQWREVSAPNCHLSIDGLENPFIKRMTV